MAKKSPHLTPKQLEVLSFIESFQQKQGYTPSQREIANHFEFRSLGTVQNYLVRLEREGVLKRNWNAKRALEIKAPQKSIGKTRPKVFSSAASSVPDRRSSETLEIPLLGRVAAGRPIEAVEVGESVSVPSNWSRGGRHLYALKVQGDSMKEDGIFNGDVVVLEETKMAESGQTVVALLENAATIKRFYKKNGKLELRPANADYKSIWLQGQEALGLQIQGVLVGLIRSYS
ncbi:MAG: repressor LexA [Bdellovibrionales bacterium CG10_big_fil_rev_8_21_14_0_10_45_34]|nr:MAG: repressor LexA [Bdellovibrionales bacterium CG10_big_fil_rev_8_21_14_0_10_45_34]